MTITKRPHHMAALALTLLACAATRAAAQNVAQARAISQNEAAAMAKVPLAGTDWIPGVGG